MLGGWTETPCRYYKIWTMWETKRRTTHRKISQMLMGPEQVTRPELFNLYDDIRKQTVD